MLDVCLLGTGGTVPLPSRWLTSCLLRWNGNEVLVDCGEGTQVALHGQGFSVKHIDTILLTHFHADHTAGLPGLLLSMAKADRTEPVTIIGPRHLKDIMQGVFLLARYIPFEIKIQELTEKEEHFVLDGLQVTAFSVKHSVPCFSYRFDLPRAPKFERGKAEANHVPLPCWGRLQKGQTVEMDGVVYTPDMVMGDARKGIRVVYSTDTRPVPVIAEQVKGADLYIGEGMYGDEEKLEKAKLNNHSLMQETAKIALEAGVKELWLTHYSPSVPDPSVYKETICSIFPSTVISKDGERKDLKFE